MALKEGAGESFHNPMDIFDMFFGGFGGFSRNQGPKRGKDAVKQLQVTLEDLYNGVTKNLSINKNVICEKCHGKPKKMFFKFI